MKMVLLMIPAFLVILASCGKDNKSGTGTVDQWRYTNPYTGTPGYGPVSSPYHNNGVHVNSILQENPCINSYGGQPNTHRIQVQVPLTQFPTVIPANDIYVGVTSFGDVAVVVGQGGNNPPLFVGYMCPRSFSQSGQGQLTGVSIGSYSQCNVKPITRASMMFPGGASADFRMLDYGSSRGQPFSPTICRR